MLLYDGRFTSQCSSGVAKMPVLVAALRCIALRPYIRPSACPSGDVSRVDHRRFNLVNKFHMAYVITMLFLGEEVQI